MYLDDLLNKAHAKHVQGKYEAAIKIYKEILKLSPNHLDAHYLLGTLYAETGQFPQAEQHLKNADQINPRSPYVKVNLGNIAFSQGDYPTARDYYRQALDIQSDLAQAYWGLGNIMDEVDKDFDGALQQYQKALDLNPNDPFMLQAAGRAMARLGNPHALEYFRKSIMLNPQLPGINTDYGLACIKFGQQAEGARYLRQAVKLDKASPEVLYFLSIAEGASPDETLKQEYAREEFDKFATVFDKTLVNDLKYSMPQQMLEFMTETLPPGFHFGHAVDLGCGTGLFGMAIKPRVDYLAGIDISSRMLELAGKRDCYNDLYEGDLIAALQGSDTSYDLFSAMDVLVYIGEVDQLFTAITAKAKPGALFAFSTESVDGDGVILRHTGRYAHSRDYIRRVAESHDCSVIATKQVPLRQDLGEWITGDMYIIRLGN